MEYQEYLAKIKSGFLNTKQTDLNGLDTLVTYEEVFKWEWVATKLKIFSFLSYVDQIDETIIKNHSETCLRYACQNKKRSSERVAKRGGQLWHVGFGKDRSRCDLLCLKKTR